jgi:phosphoglucosamine mutase
VADEVGKASRIEDACGRYIVFLKNTFPNKYTLDDFHIVLDCAHGAAYKVAPFVFSELGAQVTCIGVEPDGKNINKDCGSLHPEVMAEKVRQLGADIGLALDGDGDRLIVCDEQGRVVDGDQLMAICAEDLLARRKLKKKTLVATVMSNMGLEKAVQDMGGTLLRTHVGDRYVVEAMRAKGYNFGGEQSGHLIFLDHNTTGDGILAALQVLAIMIKRKKPISALASIMTSYPQVLENVRMASKIPPEQIRGFPEALKAAEAQLGTRGRILVRPSGTEPVIRVMVEGEDAKEISSLALELCDVIRRADRI